jgi:energy-coupling factor transporter ATP-binding protein EcfA2
MKIDSISIAENPPIGNLEVSGLSNVVVFAGPNGVGKTRLIDALLNTLRNPGSNTKSRIVVSATSEAERASWGSSSLDTRVTTDANRLRSVIQRNQQRGKWRSSAYYFDSTRQFSQVGQPSWSWEFLDPTIEQVGWDFAFTPFRNRYQDTIHAIYRMLGHHRNEIAKRALELQKSGQKSMELDFPYPLKRFKDAFRLLLAPKELADIDVTSPHLRYMVDGKVLEMQSLSSGEQEVFSVAFDLLLREPEDCIIFFDEPELHLHPELSFRLLKTLQTIGARNQFILCTHSADILSGAIEHSVVFIAPRPKGQNQGILINTADDSVTALKELGQSLGVISLGRRIVLIEGKDTSIDRDTYGAILQGRFPSLVLAPSGSRQTILSFSRILEDVLDKNVWGIDFFMVADRDNSLPDEVLNELEKRANGRLRARCKRIGMSSCRDLNPSLLKRRKG